MSIHSETYAKDLMTCFQHHFHCQFDLVGVRAPQSAISLYLEDLYLASEPIKFRARVISPNPGLEKLKAEITSVSQEGTALHLNFEQQEQESVLVVDDLKSGLYRLKVQTENTDPEAPNPVHDLFEVASK
ncbi:hypothetical protein [Anabaena catenula]|uniref:Uncharacterized protein n=1 Tax=Anabaena catenula FACHB-362 TaxID=2692877 RepID=A0ABR8JBS4_9NOST|nr:hypothetical protein [Anabaena catenula]MBD2694910.1 hypothetical protein [Anabaena catenula FACHB-362]